MPPGFVCQRRLMDAIRLIIVVVIFLDYSKCVAQSIIRATPATVYPGVTQNLTIECNFRPLLLAINDVFALQIEKSESGHSISLATVTSRGVTIDSGPTASSRMTALGDVDLNAQGPYVILTIEQPNTSDEGTYLCSAATTDKTGTLVNLAYQTTVTAEGVTINQIATLLSEMSIDIKSLREENKKLRENITDSYKRLSDLESKPCDCKLNGTISLDTQQDLVGNVTQQLMSNEASLSQLTNDITGLRGNQSSLANQIASITNTTQTVVSDIVVTITQFDKIESRLNILEKISAEQYSEIAALTTQRKRPSFSYMFANINQTSSVITFNTKIVDSLLGYQPLTGTFLAPQDGLYLFSLTIATDDGSIQAAIKVRNSLVGYVVTSATSDGPQQGATSIVVAMVHGDSALVKVSSLLNYPVNLRKDACVFSGAYLGKA